MACATPPTPAIPKRTRATLRLRLLLVDRLEDEAAEPKAHEDAEAVDAMTCPRGPMPARGCAHSDAPPQEAAVTTRSTAPAIKVVHLGDSRRLCVRRLARR